jgi:dephospho-CoA kinase
MLIGLSGKAGAGKDTVADYLVRCYKFQRMAFADPMKRFLNTLGFSVNKL